MLWEAVTGIATACEITRITWLSVAVEVTQTASAWLLSVDEVTLTAI
jgi:hypothetical protein